MNYLSLLWDLYQLKRNNGKTREQMEALQNKKLRKILKHAYRHSKYYHRTFQEASITEENIDKLPLSRFPVMDKAILMEHFDELVTVSNLKQEELRKFDEDESRDKKILQNKYHLVHSSGSTGKPAYFVYDNQAWNQMLVAIIRAALWGMTMPQIIKLLSKNLKILYIAATDGRYGGAMAVGDGIEGVRANQLFLDINTPLAEWEKSVRGFKPNIIIGYPSAIKILGELVDKEKIHIHVERIISCGEPLGSGLRQYLEETFQTNVINVYGASESLALGVEANEAEGMILFDDMNYVEVENGTMYITSLYNYIQPLIRYKISDQLILRHSDEQSRCPFTKAENLVGRNEDIMWFEDNRGNREFLHPLAIEGLCTVGLVDYQFEQIASDSFEMLAEISGSSKHEEVQYEILKQVKEILQEKHLEYVKFEIRFVDEILPNPKTGKKSLVIRLGERRGYSDEESAAFREKCL